MHVCDLCILSALFYLTEVVVDIEASASPQQQVDQTVHHGQLLLHHSYMESSEMTKKEGKTNINN